MAEQLDCLVIGAGVIGLACARALARAGRDVVVIERHGHVGEEISSRHSEVIHAGIYYPTGSLKARACVRGKALLYDFCERYGVPYRRCGKIIVATEQADFETLRGYQRQALRNGAGALEWLERDELVSLEGELRALAGLWSPSTGIIDSHAYMLSLAGDLEAHGGAIAFATSVHGAAPEPRGLHVETDAGAVCARWVINAAGLHAPSLARCLAPEHGCRLPRPYYAKGHYYTYSGSSPFDHLVYPIAEAAGLGVHVTLDLAGQARFGPDVEWIEEPDYGFDDRRREAFIAAIRRYFPRLDASRLQPGYTGIRPKISPPGAPSADFTILGPADHGVAGLVHLLGIESPGLTASLALAEQVEEVVHGA